MDISFFGLSWWQWTVLALACVATAVLAWRARGPASKREEAEILAQRADAAHEGARTHHEGGP